jgi:hypothetical protein
MSKGKKFGIGWKIAIAFGIFGLCGIAIVVRLFVQVYRDSQNFPNLHLEKVNNMPGEDSALFSKESWSKMSVDFGWKDIYGQVSFLTIDRQYQIIVAKSPLVRGGAIYNLVHIEVGNGKETNFVTYQQDRLQGHGNFSNRYTPLQPIGNIFITYSGGIAETVVSNDSVLQYHIPCENLSIRYAADSPVDMLLTSGKSNSNNADLRLDMVLVKSRDELYFLFILPVDYSVSMDPINVNGLLNKKTKM